MHLYICIHVHAHIYTHSVYGVRQLVECMVLNMGRIRLVLSRIWAVVAPHLVSAACAPDERVAKYAVGALQRLIDRLLLRAELANFTYQVRVVVTCGWVVLRI